VSESLIVMVVDEKTENRGVFELLGLILEGCSEFIHGFAISKNVVDGKVHRVVKGCIYMSLVACNIPDITIEDLSNGEYSSSLSVFTPEVSLDLWNSVNSQSIKVVLLNDVLDPSLQGASHKLIVLIEVGQICKSAIFNLVGVLPVVDLALGVVMLRLIKWIHSGVVLIDWSHMVGNDI